MTADVTPLPAPREGVPAVVSTDRGLAAAVDRLAAGTGPVAVDTERASGYRYYQRAYLVQLRRAGSGTVLLDPIAVDDVSELADLLGGLEWILHAADQDLPALAELGMTPDWLFDTELAGRLLGYERVNLAALIAAELGYGLAKGHGAADWSKRPLPADWLNYAALDVELLIELRDAQIKRLAAEGKMEWAAQEFEHVRSAPPPVPQTDRWRRTSKLHTVRGARKLAAVRELWHVRDELARELDRAPGRVLPDSAIIDAAVRDPLTVDELTALPVFSGPRQRRRAPMWSAALARARALPESELPRREAAPSGPPPPNRWKRSQPEAAERLTVVRAELERVGDEVTVPPENLLAPRLVRRLGWEGLPAPVAGGGEDPVDRLDRMLAEAGARPWQRELTAAPLAAALDAFG